MKIKLPFGIKNGSLLDISEVDSGISCDCYCPSCNHPLVAKKGNIKQHHFAHYDKPDCVGAVETALHMKAKEIISNRLRITLPPIYIANKELFGKTEVTFDHVELEKRTENIIPDIVGYSNGRPLLIEIAVNHFVEQPKKNIRVIHLDVENQFKVNFIWKSTL